MGTDGASRRHGPETLHLDLELRSAFEVGDFTGIRDMAMARLECDHSLAERCHHLRMLSFALDGLGDVAGARSTLLEAAATAERIPDTTTAARIALDYALPSDWHQPSLLGVTALSHLSEIASTPEEMALTLSARALVEARVPTEGSGGTVHNWRSQPTLARRLADEALAAGRDSTTLAQAAAALAWRSSHRAPEFVEQRRRRSEELFTLAHDTGNLALQVESAVWRCVDALEQGDRSAFDEALARGRWTADRSRNPRLIWRMAIIDHTAAYLDEDREAAHRALDRIRRHLHGAPAVDAALLDQFFLGLWTLDDRDATTLALIEVHADHRPSDNPIGLAMLAELTALQGNAEEARELVDLGLELLDPEAGYLFQLARVARVVQLLGDTDLARRVVDLLRPSEHLVAVDSDAWACEPPVSIVLAELALVLGDVPEAVRLLAQGETVATELRHRPALRRVAALSEELARRHGIRHTPGGADQGPTFTPRELEVLRRMARGDTNPAIAADLQFSLSTIRSDTTAIYRKLEASNRPDAVLRAMSLGILGSAADAVGSVGHVGPDRVERVAGRAGRGEQR